VAEDERADRVGGRPQMGAGLSVRRDDRDGFPGSHARQHGRRARLGFARRDFGQQPAMPLAQSPLRHLAKPVEEADTLDGLANAVGSNVRKLIPAGPVKDALAGTWLGHALHPILTDVVIGSFLSASLLDLLGGDDDGRAAERLLGVGIAAYGPTALTGVTDWADSEVVDAPVRRVGLVHAAGNAVALGLYTASLVARRKGDHGRGKLLALAGSGVMGGAGYLGGHLSFVKGVGVNQTAFDEGSDDWLPTGIAATDLEPGQPRKAMVAGTPVMLVRHADGVHALHDRCSHRGCSLSDGEVEGEIVECPCHGSRFDLRDGSVERGPATVDQPAFTTRQSGDSIELRLPAES
jgi:nitrite reductase/ring-hydroxylating ferredoxin subunit